VSAENDERSVQALINIESSQTIYVDVTRVITVTYKLQTNPGSSVASTTTTLASNEVLGHIELVKTDFGFASGNVPSFMHDDAQFLHILPPPLTSSIFDTFPTTAQIETTDTGLRKPTA
jgi:hypothetical protein